jgi:hypothetical protein
MIEVKSNSNLYLIIVYNIKMGLLCSEMDKPSL